VPGGEQAAQEFGPAHEMEHPGAGLELEAEGRFAEGEFGPVEMAMDDTVAEFGAHIVALAVALLLLLAAQEPGDVDLVLDRHDAVEIPERGLGRGIAVRCRVAGVHAEQARDVVLRIGEIFVADQVVDALGEERFVPRVESQLLPRAGDELPVAFRRGAPSVSAAPIFPPRCRDTILRWRGPLRSRSARRARRRVRLCGPA